MGGGGKPLVWGKNLLFGKIFTENCMKMNEIGPRGGAHLWHPLGSTNARILIIFQICYFPYNAWSQWFHTDWLIGDWCFCGMPSYLHWRNGLFELFELKLADSIRIMLRFHFHFLTFISGFTSPRESFTEWTVFADLWLPISTNQQPGQWFGLIAASRHQDTQKLTDNVSEVTDGI